MDWKMCWFDGAKHSTFYSTLFPVGFCYSQNFVEFSAQNLNNTYLGQNSQFWLREISFFFFYPYNKWYFRAKERKKIGRLFFPHKKSDFSTEWNGKSLK